MPDLTELTRTRTKPTLANALEPREALLGALSLAGMKGQV
jgi:hypothetical protein